MTPRKKSRAGGGATGRRGRPRKPRTAANPAPGAPPRKGRPADADPRDETTADLPPAAAGAPHRVRTGRTPANPAPGERVLLPRTYRPVAATVVPPGRAEALTVAGSEAVAGPGTMRGREAVGMTEAMRGPEAVRVPGTMRGPDVVEAAGGAAVASAPPMRRPVKPRLTTDKPSAAATARTPGARRSSGKRQPTASDDDAPGIPRTPARTPPRPRPRPRTPEEAFDRLYVRSARALVRQVELLTGDAHFARRAVTHAFAEAWQRWPEVARDRNPVGWVRTAAYEYALAPWQRWVPGRPPGRRPRTRTRDARHRIGARETRAADTGAPGPSLRDALLHLPPARRRALLLYDGLGLELPEAAAESEASTAATARRIARAREQLAAAVPEFAGERADEGGPGGGDVCRAIAELPARLGALLDAEPGAEPPDRPAGVRDASERGVRRRTVGAYAVAGLIAAATLVTVIVGPGGGHHTGPREAPAGVGAPHAGVPDLGAYSGPGDGAGPPPFGERARDIMP